MPLSSLPSSLSLFSKARLVCLLPHGVFHPPLSCLSEFLHPSFPHWAMSPMLPACVTLVVLCQRAHLCSSTVNTQNLSVLQYCCLVSCYALKGLGIYRAHSACPPWRKSKPLCRSCVSRATSRCVRSLIPRTLTQSPEAHDPVSHHLSC